VLPHFFQLIMSAGSGGFSIAGTLDLTSAEERSGLNRNEEIIQLFREIRQPLFSYLISIGLNSSEADDMIQEAFLRLHSHLRAGTRIDEPRAWTFRVARNLSFNFHRDHRHLVLESELDEEQGQRWHQVCNPDQSPESAYIKKETLMRMDEGMRRLTAQQRQCVHLRVQGLRYREIAAVLGISASSAAELLQRAIIRLAGEIHD